MKQQFRTIRFARASLDRIDSLQDILADYTGQKLTARQVYYQFVARGLLENNVKNYKNLTNLITNARYAGIIDWDIIEDRGREPDVPSQWANIQNLVATALRAYRLPRWEGQNSYVELWVEKQALAGVLAPIANRWHVTLMVNKGYSSSSAMKASAERIEIATAESLDRRALILYLGDHDPSGEDMVRDVADRLVEFINQDDVYEIEVRKLALTMTQVEQFNPPPNPAKITDSRAKGYIAKYGPESWELDALPPQELNRLVSEAIAAEVDQDLMQAVVAKEETDKKKLQAAAKNI